MEPLKISLAVSSRAMWSPCEPLLPARYDVGQVELQKHLTMSNIPEFIWAYANHQPSGIDRQDQCKIFSWDPALRGKRPKYPGRRAQEDCGGEEWTALNGNYPRKSERLNLIAKQVPPRLYALTS